MIRQNWIDMNDSVPTTRQCELAGVSRATIYAHQKPQIADDDDLLLCRLIDEEYTRHPFYGTRRMAVVVSATVGFQINRKRFQRLMRLLGLKGMAPGPNTSRSHPQHLVCIPTCCATWPLSNPTKFGAPTSPTFDWLKASSIWWQ